jgi:DNA-binding MarR family transcriptional regulator
MSALIAGLERQDLIARTAVDADRRGVRLELTRKGLSTIARVEQRFSSILDDASRGCDRERLFGALEELARELNTQVAARARADE